MLNTAFVQFYTKCLIKLFLFIYHKIYTGSWDFQIAVQKSITEGSKHRWREVSIPYHYWQPWLGSAIDSQLVVWSWIQEAKRARTDEDKVKDPSFL